MTDPMPLRELEGPPAARRAGADLDTVLRGYSWARDRKASVWWSLRTRAQERRRPRRSPRQLWASAVGAAALATAALAVTLWPARHVAPDAAPVAAATPQIPSDPARTPSAWTRIDMGDLGTIEASPEADVEIHELADFRELRLRSGTQRAEVLRQDPTRPVVVTTPHLRVFVVGTRFDVTVEPRRTLVDLIEGTVRVETAAASVVLHAGESIDSDDPRLNPPPPTTPATPAYSAARPISPARPAVGGTRAPRPRLAMSGLNLELRPHPEAQPPTMGSCESQPTLDGREHCFAQLAGGDDLAAQSALFALSLLATERPGGEVKALERAREYQRRFPSGALAAEAAVREIELLLALARPDQALVRVGGFEARFADDPRARDVALARAAALCSIPGRRAEAHPLIEKLMTDSDAAVRTAAIALRARCQAPEPVEATPPSAAPGTQESKRPAD